MKYYKVKPEHDGERRKDGRRIVAGELYTGKELLKFCIPQNACEVVNVAPSQTYFCFGARFQIKTIIAKAAESVDYLIRHNKNYTNEQYYKILDLRELIDELRAKGGKK